MMEMIKDEMRDLGLSPDDLKYKYIQLTKAYLFIDTFRNIYIYI